MAPKFPWTLLPLVKQVQSWEVVPREREGECSAVWGCFPRDPSSVGSLGAHSSRDCNLGMVVRVVTRKRRSVSRPVVVENKGAGQEPRLWSTFV